MEHTDDSHRQVEKILHNSNIPQNWMLIQNWQKEIGQRLPKCWHRFKKLQEFLASTGSFVDVTTIFRALHTIYLGYGVVWQDLPYLTKKKFQSCLHFAKNTLGISQMHIWKKTIQVWWNRAWTIRPQLQKGMCCTIAKQPITKQHNTFRKEYWWEHKSLGLFFFGLHWGLSQGEGN